MDAADEARLVDALRLGSPHAFESLYHLYLDRVAGLARLLLRGGPVEDAVQETFLLVFRNIGSFREEARLTTWIHRIAVNVCISELRKQTSRRAGEGALTEPNHAPDLEEAASVRQAGGVLLAILRDLDPAKQAAFYLHHVQGLSASEISDIVGEPRATVLKRLQRTRVEVLEIWRDRHGGGEPWRGREADLFTADGAPPELARRGTR